MDLRVLQYFSAVVEQGSFTAAARALHLSQPSLSSAISKLESELGTRLLIRSPRGVTPTRAGWYLLESSGRVLGDIENMRTTLGRFAQGLEGSISIAAVPALTWSRIPKLLKSLQEHAPSLEVRLSAPPPWTAIEALQYGKTDAAAIMVADAAVFTERYRHEFDVTDWGEIPLAAVLAPGARANTHEEVVNSFPEHTLVVPQRTRALASLPEVVEQFLAIRRITPQQIIVADTIQLCIPYIQAGVGWGILPDPDGASLRHFGLPVRRLHGEHTALRALILTHPEKRHDAGVHRLLTSARESCQDAPLESSIHGEGRCQDGR